MVFSTIIQLLTKQKNQTIIAGFCVK